MKKILIITLFSALILGFTGCGNEDTLNIAEATEIYGNNCEVYVLSPTHFLLSWEQQDESVDIIFKNNQVVEHIEHDGKLEKIEFTEDGVQIHFTDNTGYWFE